MTERQFYKHAYKEIFNNRRTHQDVYDEEVKESLLGPETVARTISMTPSREKNDGLKGLWMTFIALVVIGAIMRIAIMVIYDQFSDLSITGLIFAGLLILSPILAFIGATKAKIFFYGFTTMIITAALIRAFFSDDYGSDELRYAMAGLAVVTFVLSSIIPRRLRVGYTRHVVDKEKDSGKIVKSVSYTFDETKKMSRKEVFKENY
jgi:hypothetical protein